METAPAAPPLDTIPLTERLQSRNAKHRAHGYSEVLKTASRETAELSSLLNGFDVEQAMTENSPAILLKGMQLSLLYLNSQPEEVECAKIASAVFVKALGGRPNVRQIAIQLIDTLIEQKGAGFFLSYLVPQLTHRQPRIVQNAAEALQHMAESSKLVPADLNILFQNNALKSACEHKTKGARNAAIAAAASLCELDPQLQDRIALRKPLLQKPSFDTLRSPDSSSLTHQTITIPAPSKKQTTRVRRARSSGALSPPSPSGEMDMELTSQPGPVSIMTQISTCMRDVDATSWKLRANAWNSALDLLQRTAAILPDFSSDFIRTIERRLKRESVHHCVIKMLQFLAAFSDKCREFDAWGKIVKTFASEAFAFLGDMKSSVRAPANELAETWLLAPAIGIRRVGSSLLALLRDSPSTQSHLQVFKLIKDNPEVFDWTKTKLTNSFIPVVLQRLQDGDASVRRASEVLLTSMVEAGARSSIQKKVNRLDKASQAMVAAAIRRAFQAEPIAPQPVPQQKPEPKPEPLPQPEEAIRDESDTMESVDEKQSIPSEPTANIQDVSKVISHPVSMAKTSSPEIEKVLREPRISSPMKPVLKPMLKSRTSEIDFYESKSTQMTSYSAIPIDRTIKPPALPSLDIIQSDPAQSLPLVISGLGDANRETAVDALKALQLLASDHLMAVVDHADEVTSRLSSQIQSVFSNPDSNSRLCKHLLNTTHILFSPQGEEAIFATVVGIDPLSRLFSTLLGALIDKNLHKSKKGAVYVNAFNNIVLLLLQFCDISTVLCALIRVLREAFMDSRQQPDDTYIDVVVRCICKLLPSISTADDLCIDVVLRELNLFLSSYHYHFRSHERVDTVVSSICTKIIQHLVSRNDSIDNHLHQVPIRSQGARHLVLVLNEALVEAGQNPIIPSAIQAAKVASQDFEPLSSSKPPPMKSRGLSALDLKVDRIDLESAAQEDSLPRDPFSEMANSSITSVDSFLQKLSEIRKSTMEMTQKLNANLDLPSSSGGTQPYRLRDETTQVEPETPAALKYEHSQRYERFAELRERMASLSSTPLKMSTQPSSETPERIRELRRRLTSYK